MSFMSYTPGFGDVYTLVGEINEAYDSVQGNPKLCKLLNDQVQHVASSLKVLPDVDQRKPNVQGTISSLIETLKDCLALIGEFQETDWINKIKKIVLAGGYEKEFNVLFDKLDRVLQVCEFSLEVRLADIKSAQRGKNHIKHYYMYKSSASKTMRWKAQRSCLDA